MIGFCSRCKEYRGDYGDWDIVMQDGYPVCEKCGAFVDVLEGDE